MNIISKSLIVLLALGASVLPVMSPAGHAQQAQRGGQGTHLPLIVIRFKDPNIEYQKSLHAVILSALKAKPNVFFDVLTVIPQAPYESMRKKLEQAGAVRTQEIVTLMMEMGVKPQQMQIRSSFSAFVEAPEVQIFVR